MQPKNNSKIIQVLFTALLFVLIFSSANAQIPLDQSYPKEFYSLYFSHDLGDKTAKYLLQVEKNEKLSYEFDRRIDHYQQESKVTMSRGLATNLKSGFFGFYAFLTYAKPEFSAFYHRSPFSDEAVAKFGFDALDEYLLKSDKQDQSLKNLWITKLGLKKEVFYNFLAKINIDRPRGGFKTPEFTSYSAAYFKEQLSLNNEYVTLDITSKPEDATITVDGTQVEKHTPRSISVPIKNSPSTITITISKAGFEPVTQTKTVSDYQEVPVNATLPKKKT